MNKNSERTIQLKESKLMETMAELVKSKSITELQARIYLSQMGVHYKDRDRSLKEALGRHPTMINQNEYLV